MDVEIFLEIGSLIIDRHRDRHPYLDYSLLFQSRDETKFKYSWVDELADATLREEITEVSNGYRRPLRSVVPRLELLGYSLEQVGKMYEDSRRRSDDVSGSRFKFPPDPPFETVVEAFRRIGIEASDSGFAPYVKEKTLRKEVAAMVIAVSSDLPAVEGPITLEMAYESIPDRFDPFELLQMLAQNPANLDLPVSWHPFYEVLNEFIPDEEEITVGARRNNRFLVVTEGSSDTAVIQKALALLRPDVADFFEFIDMEKNYPLTGIGNLHNFYQGLLKIGILNKVLFIYDNDAVGSSKHEAASKLPAPTNIRILKLPDLEAFADFRTIGPTGEGAANINGRAASIECYLDLKWQTDRLPRVRWTSYQPDTGLYQGELEDKQAYVRRFLALSESDLLSYDVSRLELLLESVLKECAAMAQELLDEEWRAES